MQILSHNDRNKLKSNEYLLETLEPRPVIARDISDKLRLEILERNGYTCQVCGAGAGEESGCEQGRKCRLQIDHVIPISQGGRDDEHNLRAVCVYYNKDNGNLKVPTSRDAISAMALMASSTAQRSASGIRVPGQEVWPQAWQQVSIKRCPTPSHPPNAASAWRQSGPRIPSPR
jgi:hypothetical protein